MLLTFSITFSMAACIKIEVADNSSENGKGAIEVQKEASDEEYATKESPADIRSVQTIKGTFGEFSFKLENAYLGDAAISKLIEMGEDKDMIQGFVNSEENYRAVLLEYNVSAGKGFETEPFVVSEILGNDLWDIEYKSKYEYVFTNLMKNANLDAVNLTLKTGEESKAYALYALPENTHSFVNSISGENKDYWFIYNLD